MTPKDEQKIKTVLQTLANLAYKNSIAIAKLKNEGKTEIEYLETHQRSLEDTIDELFT
ncbi:MAG: hypothetical protein JWP12_881 [Bacteroidetes bacterium]|nr:hypothetical protein [Bacteroidota bacterium]